MCRESHKNKRIMKPVRTRRHVLSDRCFRPERMMFSLIAAGMILLASAGNCSAQDRMNGPAMMTDQSPGDRYGAGRNVALDVYQRWLSPVKGGNTCPMYPSCSQYAKQAFEVLPWYVAYVRTLERLLRCGHDLQFYHRISVDGSLLREDRIRNNETPCAHEQAADHRVALPPARR